MKLSEKTRHLILELQSNYPEKRSALIPALHLAQKEIGYLPYEIQREIAELFGIPVNEVNAVVTFYDMFFDKPIGKHHIRVCKNASCMLRGSDKLLHQICKKLNIKPWETSKDGEFTIMPSECLAACDRAPMLLMDEDVIGPITEDDLDALFSKAKEMEGNPCPLTADMEEGHG